MDVTRAGFLKSFGAAVIGLGARAWPWRVDGGTAGVNAGARRPIGPWSASLATLGDCVNTVFRVQVSAEDVADFILARAQDGSSCADVLQFSLVFHGPGDADLPDGVYEIRHDRLGPDNLFITRVGPPTPGRSVYQACFSRFAAAQGDPACPTYS